MREDEILQLVVFGSGDDRRRAVLEAYQRLEDALESTGNRKQKTKSGGYESFFVYAERVAKSVGADLPKSLKRAISTRNRAHHPPFASPNTGDAHMACASFLEARTLILRKILPNADQAARAIAQSTVVLGTKPGLAGITGNAHRSVLTQAALGVVAEHESPSGRIEGDLPAIPLAPTGKLDFTVVEVVEWTVHSALLMEKADTAARLLRHVAPHLCDMKANPRGFTEWASWIVSAADKVLNKEFDDHINVARVHAVLALCYLALYDVRSAVRPALIALDFYDRNDPETQADLGSVRLCVGVLEMVASKVREHGQPISPALASTIEKWRRYLRRYPDGA